MAKSKQQITSDIKDHIADRGGAYTDWYVGIAADARERLFEEHDVQERGDAWIYRQAESNAVAREIERHFIDSLGTDGGPGGGDSTTDKVYAYKKKSHTDP